MKKILIQIVLPIICLGIFPLQTAKAGVAEATAYLLAQSDNPWVTMALSAVGEETSGEYLRSTDGSTAIEFAAPILAITAIGEDPRTFSNTNLIEELKSYYTDGQMGDSSTLNDDIFGLLAFLSAGEPSDDTAVAGTKDFILQNQNEDGGWGFSIDGGSDTNMTTAAIMALTESGVSDSDTVIQNAVAYLKSAQNADGGFPYDPHGMWGTDSDASSDAWIISAVTSMGGDIDDWAIEGVGGPTEHLLSLQAEGGYFQYQMGTGEDGFSPITTSYAVIALVGKSYPVNSISYSPSEPADEDDDVEEEENHSGGGGGGSASKESAEDTADTEDTTDTEETTLAQLQAELEKLVALLSRLQASVTADSGAQRFTRDLDAGSTGEDVRGLQQYLNAHSFILTASGYGSPGNETIFFGELTRAALARFQIANNIIPSVGFFGPITRAYISLHP
ncbi:MAG: prenyltransferase/squalene oxidase repeat-containing protein [Candidatus Colwellbacteria bacterium]|nr:prenyltransferase/squalene oxidase repeat-containing protein [Candidatus Colwellbacteria bacterium]